MTNLSTHLHLLTEPTRFRITTLLLESPVPLTPTLISARLSIPLDMASRHLTVLADAQLVGYATVGASHLYFVFRPKLQELGESFLNLCKGVSSCPDQSTQ